QADLRRSAGQGAWPKPNRLPLRPDPHAIGPDRLLQDQEAGRSPAADEPRSMRTMGDLELGARQVRVGRDPGGRAGCRGCMGRSDVRAWASSRTTPGGGRAVREYPVFIPWEGEHLAAVLSVPEGRARALALLPNVPGAPRSHRYQVVALAA